jgi:carboxypeptidase Taq
VPGDLVAALARQQVRGAGVWARARAAADFGVFAPELRAMVALQRERAAALDGHVPAYDALHDLYERGATAAGVASGCSEPSVELADLLREIQASPVRPDAAILRARVPGGRPGGLRQGHGARHGLRLRARPLDRTAHPFAIRVGPGDVRITTRYHPRQLAQALFSTIHEAGHGMYEQNLPASTPTRRSPRPPASPSTSRSRGSGRT